jgi:ankyrin repeat protein
MSESEARVARRGKKNVKASQELVLAAARGDEPAARLALAEGAYPDFRLPKGNGGVVAGERALAAACAAGSAECVTLLAPLSGREWRDMDVGGSKGSWSQHARRTLFQLAAGSGSASAVLVALVEQGVDPLPEDAFELMKGLMRSLARDRGAALAALAERVDLASMKDKDDNTLLMIAASLGDGEAALALLPLCAAAGVEALNVKNKQGWNVLTWAAMGWPEGVNALIAAGAQEGLDSQGRSALYWAAKRGSVDAVSALLPLSRPDPSLPGLAALTQAATKGRHECVAVLLSDPIEGAQSRLDTALAWTAGKGEMESLRLLLDAGANPTARVTRNLKTALMLAAHRGMLEAGQCLAPLSDLEAVDDQGRTALEIARLATACPEFYEWLAAWTRSRQELDTLSKVAAGAAPSEKRRL